MLYPALFQTWSIIAHTPVCDLSPSPRSRSAWLVSSAPPRPRLPAPARARRPLDSSRAALCLRAPRCLLWPDPGPASLSASHATGAPLVTIKWVKINYKTTTIDNPYLVHLTILPTHKTKGFVFHLNIEQARGKALVSRSRTIGTN